MSKISGPLVDRIDVQLEVPAVPFKELSDGQPGTSSAEMREQVLAARRIQAARFTGSSTRYNAKMRHQEIRRFCRLDSAGQALLKSAMQELGLSARAHDKVLRVARTIADLESSEQIEASHLSEAINYRMLDRSLWT